MESLIAQGGTSFLETAVGAAAAPPSVIGRQLGAYRVEAAIGSGGMGEVYRAKDTRLERDVALKILPAAFAADPQRRARFEREARAVAALKHPNICTIHDVGHDAGIDFLVMELVDGETLAARLTRGPLPLGEALARAIEIADALDNAHRLGIIHRDLKPGNVMLAQSGSGQPHAVHAKLLDFSLARIIASGVEDRLAVPTGVPTTEAGTVLGTVQYMAPEQIEGRPADARTDIFAFGVVLYEMLTGLHAFEGTSTAALMAAILRGDPPSVLPREVDRIVRRCLEKDPMRRYQSARDLVNDLDEVRQGLANGRLTSAHAPSAQGSGNRNAIAWLAVGLVVTVAIAGYLGWTRLTTRPSTRVERFQLQPPPGVKVVPADVNSVLAVSPDGQWVAFRGIGGQLNEDALYLRPIGDLEAKKIAPGGKLPFFSPDSRWLGFFAENLMYKVPVTGGQPQPICKVPNILSQRGASWSDSGTIVFSSEKALWRVSAVGGEPMALTRPVSSIRHYWPQVLPGSAAAVFIVNEGNSDRWRRIAVVSLKTGEVRIFAELSGTAPHYVSSGHLVYSRFGALYAVPFDLSRLEVRGEPVKVLDNVSNYQEPGSTAFDVSMSGSLVYIPGIERTPEAEVIWLDRGGNIAPLLEERRRYAGAALDPDGRRLALAIANDLGEADLWVYEIDRGARTRLTTGMQVGTTLAWSPDGKWVFFTSFKSGEAELYRIPSEGGTVEQLTSDVTVWEFPGSVSPDGSTLLFWQTTASQADLMTLTIQPRGTPKSFTDSPAVFEALPAFSPDGHWVAYESDETGSREIHVRPFPGPGDGIRVSSGGGTSPWWSRDGRELFYQRAPEIWSVAVQMGATFQHAEPRMLFKADFLAGRPAGFLASGSSGTHFVAIRREQQTPLDRMLVYVPAWVDEVKRTVRGSQ